MRTRPCTKALILMSCVKDITRRIITPVDRNFFVNLNFIIKNQLKRSLYAF